MGREEQRGTESRRHSKVDETRPRGRRFHTVSRQK